MMHRIWMLTIVLLVVLSSCIGLPEWDVDPHRLADENGQFLTLNDIEIYYIDEGEPTNPAVILVHGFGASTFSWRMTIQPLVEAGYRVIALDRPGFGLSQKYENIDYTSSAQADLLAALMDEFDIETATLVGHSQGGGIVTQFAVRHPDRLDKLVIVDGAVIRAEGGDGGDVGNPLIDLVLNPNPILREILEHPLARFMVAYSIGVYFDEEQVANLMASAYGDPALITPGLIEGYYRAFRTPEWERGLIAMGLAEERDPLTDEDIRHIETETLLLWGEADTWVPLPNGERLHELLSNSTLKTYPGIGHSPMDTVPEAFNADLIGFLSN